MNKLRKIYASAYSAALSIVVVVVMTLGAELSPGFKSWLAGFTGHHWVTKSWIAVILFVLGFGVFSLLKKDVSDVQARRAVVLLNVVSVLGFLTILLFYCYEFFKH